VNARETQARSLRIGQGFDVHRFSSDPQRKLVLGGLTVEDSEGLEGHSDADVLTHALADALLGAACLGELGTHFPASEPKWAGVRSMHLLENVVGMLRAEHLRTLNADCTLVCERPRLGARTQEMGRALGAAVGAPVSVKVKSAEMLGALGRAEGIACWAVALVEGHDAGA
jgi:2-C-methyl-D-erythritol 2,4-cyclodiphosphate synthase